MRTHQKVVTVLVALGALGLVGVVAVVVMPAVTGGLAVFIATTALGASARDGARGSAVQPSPRPVDDVTVTTCAVDNEGGVTVRLVVRNRSSVRRTYVGTVDVRTADGRQAAPVFATPVLAAGQQVSVTTQAAMTTAPAYVTCRATGVDVVTE